MEEVKETLISDCDTINEPVIISIPILLDTEEVTSASSEPVVECKLVISLNTLPDVAFKVPVIKTSDAVIAPLALKIKEPLRALISWVSILKSATWALENVASPCAVMIAVGVPAAGNDKELAANEPSTVTSLVILPLVNKTSEPVIPPLLLKIKLSFDDFIWLSFTMNPPIDAEVNLAAPSAVILAIAFVDVEPPGTNMELADKLLLITASPPIVNPPSGFKWKLEELISMLSSEPLTNWTPSLPKKNLFVLTSNSPTPSSLCVLNLNEPLFPSCISKPTPS